MFRDIERTTKTLAKVEALVGYLQEAGEEDKSWCIALLMGKKHEKSIKSGSLKQWAMDLGQLPQWLFDESYHIVGDLAETIALVLPEPLPRHRSYSLSDTLLLLSAMRDWGEADKELAIKERWMHMAANERLVFNKLMTGNFRMGLSKQLVIRALARYLSLDEALVAHRLMGPWDPRTESVTAMLRAEDRNAHYRPYPFYLAYALEKEPEELGAIGDWQIEHKLDGIRGQLIVRNGALHVWSRGEELMTDKFPEFHPLAHWLPSGTVLDGEILPWKADAPMLFSVMQTRLGRKTIGPKQLASAPLVMVCFDMLECDGNDIRDRPLSYRRAELERLLENVPQAQGTLRLSPLLECSAWEDARAERELSRERYYEGLMLKKKDSPYGIGRRKGNWWKWKVDPLTIDGVLVYAQQGHGRRANLLTDYTFAVWDGDELVPFAKAYSGLTDKEIDAVDRWAKRNTLEKFGPVRRVRPELVFELAFEGIQTSNRHKSGVAVRFPRIVRWRKDKPVAEANTKQDLWQLLEANGR